MSEDKLIEKARTFAKNGELQRAKDILEALDSPRAQALLNRVNQAISAKKQAALSQRSQSPQKAKNTDLSAEIAKGIKQAKTEEKQAKAKQQGIGCLVLLVICAVCWISILPYMPNQPQDSIVEVCKWIDGISQEDTCTPSRIMRDYRPQVDACYDVWHGANIYNIGDWAECLENKSVDLTD
jgi:hypothetical protein